VLLLAASIVFGGRMYSVCALMIYAFHIEVQDLFLLVSGSFSNSLVRLQLLKFDQAGNRCEILRKILIISLNVSPGGLAST
jgi:hypothetical protein